MKYIEELTAGDTFESNGLIFLLTVDFKKSGDKLAYCLINGSPKWFSSQTIVEAIPVYSLDNENNPVAIKQNVSYKTQNIH
jgi:hypothetical protein